MSPSFLNYKKDKSNAEPTGFLWNFRGDKMYNQKFETQQVCYITLSNSVLFFFTLLCPHSCCGGKDVKCCTLDWSPLSASETEAFWRSPLPCWAVDFQCVFSQAFRLIIFLLLPHFALALSCHHRLSRVEDIQLSAAVPQLLLCIGRRGCERVTA